MDPVQIMDSKFRSNYCSELTFEKLKSCVKLTGDCGQQNLLAGLRPHCEDTIIKKIIIIHHVLIVQDTSTNYGFFPRSEN